jgi:hypothetical protein
LTFAPLKAPGGLEAAKSVAKGLVKPVASLIGASARQAALQAPPYFLDGIPPISCTGTGADPGAAVPIVGCNAGGMKHGFRQCLERDTFVTRLCEPYRGFSQDMRHQLPPVAGRKLELLYSPMCGDLATLRSWAGNSNEFGAYDTDLLERGTSNHPMGFMPKGGKLSWPKNRHGLS